MKLSEIDDTFLTDKQIHDIVYSNIEDDNLCAKYALVFGNDMLIKQRVEKAVSIYKSKRAKKLIFMGGTNGISNQNNSNISEADKMKILAIELGVNENDILLDDLSNNTFENIENGMNLIKDSINNILIITSQFHLKRCFAILKKFFPTLHITMISATDGFSDSDNWFLSDNSWNSGRSLATYEAHLLVKYAKEHKIEDLDIHF